MGGGGGLEVVIVVEVTALFLSLSSRRAQTRTQSSRVPSEASSARSDRIVAYGTEALFPQRKEWAAGDKDQLRGPIPGPPNEEEPYIPIHPLLAK